MFRLVRRIFNLNIKVDSHLLLGWGFADSTIEILILLVILLYAIKLIFIKGQVSRKIPNSWPVWGFLLICGSSVFYSVNQNVSMRSLLHLSAYIIFFYAVLHAIDKAQAVNFTRFLVAVAVVRSLFENCCQAVQLKTVFAKFLLQPHPV